MNQEISANDTPQFVTEYIRTNPHDRYVDLEDLDNEDFVLASGFRKNGEISYFIECDKSIGFGIEDILKFHYYLDVTEV